MYNFDLLVATTTQYNYRGEFTGYEVLKINLLPIDAIIGVLIALTILSVFLFKKNG
jgi:hypothetical protein